MNVDELVENFAALGDWEERYRYLIELGRALPSLPDAERTEAHKVRGCMSQVWLAAELRPGQPPQLDLRGDSDAHIVKGLIALLFKLYQGLTPRQVVELDVRAAFARLGLENQITMNRRNGFYAMVERIRALAAAADGAAA
ncbi:MAG TPA: SufE family protein [Verrucomicrobiae bacterium]|nr:SufE family protein [Verrucomicrobiae bacterium]